MTARYFLTEQAKQDLAQIGEYIAQESGLAPAEYVVRELQHAFKLLAEQPDAGHARKDVTDDAAVRFWNVYSYLIVYVPRARPLAIVSVLHCALDPKGMAAHIRKAR